MALACQKLWKLAQFGWEWTKLRYCKKSWLPLWPTLYLMQCVTRKSWSKQTVQMCSSARLTISDGQFRVVLWLALMFYFGSNNCQFMSNRTWRRILLIFKWQVHSFGWVIKTDYCYMAADDATITQQHSSWHLCSNKSFMTMDSISIMCHNFVLSLLNMNRIDLKYIFVYLSLLIAVI